jgi:hypothetical protein
MAPWQLWLAGKGLLWGPFGGGLQYGSGGGDQYGYGLSYSYARRAPMALSGGGRFHRRIGCCTSLCEHLGAQWLEHE